MTNKPQIVIFEVGNVLLNADQTLTFAFLKKLGVPTEHARTFFSNPDYLAFARGTISSQEFYRVLVDTHLQTPLTYEQVLAAHNQQILDINSAVQAIIQSLPKNLVVFATDTNEWQTAREKELIDLTSLSAHVFRSNELHKIKTDHGYFEFLANSLGVPTRDLLLIDDDPKNIAAAQASGLQGYTYVDPVQLKKYIDTVVR